MASGTDALGTTFSRYIARKRLERIKVDDHPKDAGTSVNLSPFIRLSKRRCGCTPSRFRISHG